MRVEHVTYLYIDIEKGITTTNGQSPEYYKCIWKFLVYNKLGILVPRKPFSI